MLIYFDVTENSLSDYILQYNSCGIVCYSLEDIVSERSENRHFRPSHSHLIPLLQRTPANVRIKLILLETKDPCMGYIFASDSMQNLVVSSETHVCNATECIIAVQGYFWVNQGR